MDVDPAFVGRLTPEQAFRLNMGEITLEQARAFAEENTAVDRRRLQSEIAEAHKARQRNRKWLGL